MKNKFVIDKWACRFALAGLALMGLPTFAQDVQDIENASVPVAPEQMATNAVGRLPITASAGLAEQFSSKVNREGQPGGEPSFSITRFNLSLKAPVRLNDDYPLATSFRYGMDAYNFNFINAPASPPWHNINTIQVASVLSYKIDDTWTAYGGGFLKMSADNDVALTKGTTGGALVGFNYKVNDTLNLGAGFGLASQLGKSTSLLPLITAKWQFADDWRLDVGLTDVATMGYGAEVKWHANDAWDFGFGIQYHRSRFAIARPSGTPAGQVGDGVGQEKAATLYADAIWHAAPQVDLDGFVGLAAGGNVAAYDNHRDKIWGYNYNPAAILGVKCSVRF